MHACVESSLRALAVVAGLVIVAVVGTYMYAAPVAADDRRDDHRRPASRRRSTSSATPTPSRTSSPRPRPTRCSASATCTRRIACGRWSSSAASATAGCPKSSARRRCRRTGFCGRSGFGRAAQRGVGQRRPNGRSSRSNAYVAGVNAFIATHHGTALPPEFSLLRFEPEAVDRRRRHGLGEDDGVGSERATTRSSCCATISFAPSAPERMAQLMPPYADDRAFEHARRRRSQ